jgi:hypothetical protein
MNRSDNLSATCGALMLVGASMAIAQEPANLGEILDKGAKRLEAGMLKALVTGAKVEGKSFKGRTEIEFTYQADGKVTGRVWYTHPDVSPAVNGTWSINDQGRLCVDLMGGWGQFKGCNPWYSVNNVYYSAESDDRSAFARMRKVKR